MTKTSLLSSKRWGLVGLAAVLVLGLALLLGSPSAASADNTLPAPVTQGSTDNAACLGCHNTAGQIHKLGNGETISVSIDQKGFVASVHGKLTCTTCHTDISVYPHPKREVKSTERYAQVYKDSCKNCHQEQYKQTHEGNVHFNLPADKQINGPVCNDCHNPHTQTAVRDANKNLLPAERLKIPTTCARCHSAIFDEYAKSVHGTAVLKENNTDTPTCTDCHGVHAIGDPTTNAFRLSSVQLCANCHTNASIMKKYNISTEVLNTYIADFHGTTVTLFEKKNPNELTNKPVCYDCHGVHSISKTDDPKNGLTAKQNLLVTCQKCHPDAASSFPESWMSHYIPSQERYPLVYYVNLAYAILIPAVLGAMAIYIASDIYRKLRTRGKKATSAAASKE